MVSVGDIRMQAWRAGEHGLPVVWMQDMHNYFAPQGEPNFSKQFVAGSAPQREFLAKLGQDYRAHAPMRRGYGDTDDDGAYDIPTHGLDLIAMLDSEGIERAILICSHSRLASGGLHSTLVMISLASMRSLLGVWAATSLSFLLILKCRSV